MACLAEDQGMFQSFLWPERKQEREGAKFFLEIFHSAYR